MKESLVQSHMSEDKDIKGVQGGRKARLDHSGTNRNAEELAFAFLPNGNSQILSHKQNNLM